MSIYLIRHAQSQANVDPSILQYITNQKVEITNIGKEQAVQTATFLSQQDYDSENVIVWNSPYTRTRQTADFIFNALNDSNRFFSVERKENILLSERQLGLVEVINGFAQKYKEENHFYNLYKEQGDEFFVTPVMGESPFSLCQRIALFIQNLRFMSKKVHIIVAHGAVIRAFNVMYRDLNYEQYSIENPFNASVYRLTDEDYKMIFAPNPRTK